MQGGHPPEVDGEEDLGDGHAAGGGDLGAGPGQLLGLGEPAGLGQGEYLVDEVHGRVGDGQLVAERDVVGVAGLGHRHRLGGPAGDRQGGRRGDGPDDPGPPVAAGEAVEHGQRPAGVAGERQHRGLVGHELFCQRRGGDDRPGGGVDGQRRLGLAQAPLGVLGPGDGQPQGDVLAAR